MSETETEQPVSHPDPRVAEKVRSLAKVKRAEAVARAIGVPMATFDTHYARDYQMGIDEADAGVTAKLLAQAMAGNANAAGKWFVKMGLVLPQKVELTGKNGGPIAHIDLTRLNDEQLKEYGRLSAIAEGLDPDAIIVEQR